MRKRLKAKMNKRIIRILSLILSSLILLSTVILLGSCKGSGNTGGGIGGSVKDREYNEAEVLEAAEKLIKKSETLNDIYWGYGIPYVDDVNLSNGSYFPADEGYLAKIGISSLADLDEMTRSVFSDYICQWIKNSVLSSGGSGSNMYVSRYGESYDEPKYILVNKYHEVLLKDTVEYDYDSLKVVGAKGDLVTVSIKCKVTNEDNDTVIKTIEVDLIEESDGWRLDTPTYVVYSK